jgi:hypothetical protein
MFASSILHVCVFLVLFGIIKHLYYAGMTWLNIIHLLHAGEGNMKIDSPKSIIFPEGNARGEYDICG